MIRPFTSLSRNVAFLALLIALGLAPPPASAQTAAEAIGSWALTLERGDQPITFELTIWDEEGELKGTWAGPRGSSELSDVRFGDGRLSFVRQVDFQGQSFSMSFSGTVSGDRLSGELTTPRGSRPIEGTRGAASEAETAAGATDDEEDDTELVPASELPIADASEFLGAWALQMNFQGTAIQIELELSERDGKLVALLVSPQGDQPITDIARGEDGLTFAFDSGFGKLELIASVDGGTLTGTFGDTSGQFSTPVSGSKSASNPTGRFSRRARRSSRPEATLALGSRPEKWVRVAYATPSTSDPEFAQITDPAAGKVVEYTRHPAIKLMTDLDLRFGELTLAYGNVNDKYPGVYSLWLKPAADGWRLVANRHADVWGTMHDPSVDIGEIPLAHSRSAEAVERLTVALESIDGEGRLELAWGEHRWQTRFTASP